MAPIEPLTPDWEAGARQRPALAEEVHVWRAELDRPGGRPVGDLPTPERWRAARLARPRTRRRWVAARWALREVLALYLDRDPAAIELVSGERGKPALAAGAGELRFNLSHSGGLALVAVAAGREVGVDVERLDPRRDVLRLAARALDPAAAAAVRAAPRGDRSAVFHREWARREAVAKCVGAGLWAPLPDVPVSVSRLEAGPDYAAALAVAGPALPPLRLFALPEGSRHRAGHPGARPSAASRASA